MAAWIGVYDKYYKDIQYRDLLLDTAWHRTATNGSPCVSPPANALAGVAERTG
jgi:hypothetical protein